MESENIEVLPGGTEDGRAGRGRIDTPEGVAEYFRKRFALFLSEGE